MRGSGSARSARAIVAAAALLIALSSAIEMQSLIARNPKFRRGNFRDRIEDI